MPAPDAVSPLRKLLGFFNYYRHFVPNFASIAKPLNALTGNAKWEWGIAQQGALDSLKQALCVEGLALRRPHPDRLFLLHTDWSTSGIGVVLGQLDEDGKEYMVACASRGLNSHEGNYEPWKGELLALVWGVRHFRVYLLGRHFVAVTDHRPLLWMLTQQAPVGQLYRWVLILQEFTFDVLHRDGIKHQNADALSRLPLASVADHTGARLDLDSDPIITWLPKVTTRLGRPPVDLPAATLPRTLEELQHAMLQPWHPPPSLKGEGVPVAVTAVVTTEVHPAAVPTVVSVSLHTVMAAAAQLVPASAALRQAAIDYADFLDPGQLCADGSYGDRSGSQPQLDSLIQPQHLDADAVLKAAASLYVSKATAVGQLQVESLPLVPVTGSAGIDLTLVSPSFFSHLPQGVSILEVFGGICAGLEAVLHAGWPVANYYYVDIDPIARAIACHRVMQLRQLYPHLLPATALFGAFTTLPDDVCAVTTHHIHWLVAHHPGQWLVVGGWECQDLSPAGTNRGLKGSRSSTFYPLRNILLQLQMLCAQNHMPAPAYVVENTAFQFNWKSQQVAQEDFAQVTAELGTPIVLDAVQFNSYAHRLRNFWTNLILPAEMTGLCNIIRRAPNLLADDILSPGRASADVSRDDLPPFYPVNKRGQPRSAFPTIMAYPGTRSTRPGQSGAIRVLETGEHDELSGDERERAMGFAVGSTAAPQVSELQRRAALGRCIDMNTLSHLFVLAAAVDHRRVSIHPACHRQLLSCAIQPDPSAASAVAARRDDGVAAALAQAAPAHDVTPLVVATVEGAEVDIWEDRHVLQRLQGGPELVQVSPKEAARVAARAGRYQWAQGKLFKQGQDGSTREVPPPEQRLTLVREHHEQLGHFGVKRTISLLLHNYWWKGLTVMVKAFVQACVLCGRSNAKFTTASPALQPLPVRGPGYRWHIDLAGPLPTTERGHNYVLVAVEAFTKWAVLVPIRDKTPESTAYAYLHQVYAYYGGSAELVTDQGGEWEGQFHQQLVKLKVDHRHTSAYHPQGNGMAERVVGVMKQGLRKACTEAVDKLKWDWQVPAVMLGYNCSKQTSTRISPFQLMHGVTPLLPAQLQGTFSVCLDPTAAEAADFYWARAVLLHQLGGATWQNVLIAQQRDTARYARVRGGGYLPELLQLEPGMLVYLRALQPTGLSLPAQQTILQIVQVRPSGVVLLLGADGNVVKRRLEQLSPCHLPNVQLTINRQLQYATDDTRCVSCGAADKEDVMLLCDNCGTAQHTFCLDPPLAHVPKGCWICPSCVAQGCTKEQVDRQQREWDRQQAELRQQERLTPSIQQAAALDGSWLRYQQRGARGWKGQVNYGKVHFQGTNPAGHPVLLVKYQCGQQEELSLRGCSSKYRKLLPSGTEPPAATASVGDLLHAAAVGWVTPGAPALQCIVQLVHNRPWSAFSRHSLERLVRLWPLAVSTSTAHWASHVWVAPDLASQLPAVKQHCWWAVVTTAPSRPSEHVVPSTPLLLMTDSGAGVKDVVEAAQRAGINVVLCVLVSVLRQGQVKQLCDAPGTVVVPVEDGWAVWWWPPWPHLHALPALCQMAIAET